MTFFIVLIFRNSFTFSLLYKIVNCNTLYLSLKNLVMLRKCILLFVLFAISFGTRAQTIVTDRPDQTESSLTVPLKSLQIESGILITNEESGLINQILIPTSLFRYGLTDRLELRLVQQFENSENDVTSQNNFGISDLVIGAKIQLLKKENINTQIAFLSHLILPIGSNELTNDKFGTVNKLAISHTISDHMGLAYNIGYDNFGEGKGDISYSLSSGLGLTNKVGTYVEFYGTYAEFSDWVTNFDSGLTYLLKDNLQLDISFGLGLNHKMHYFSLGCSWNIGKI